MKIAIASGKGGTGKTTLSVNLASYLAEKQQVVLVDLDVEEPNSGLFFLGKEIFHEDQFKMIPEWVEDPCTLCGICQDACAYHAVIQLDTQIMVFPELCHSCYACSELCPTAALPMRPQKMGQLRHFEVGPLSFVESRLDIGEEQAVPLIAKTKHYVEQHFPEEIWQIYDSPPGTSCPVIEATKTADLVILVTEPTPFGLHDLKLAVETMKELGKIFVVVINRDGLGDEAVSDYCRENGVVVAAKIPNSRQIAELYSKGKLIYAEVPEFRKQLDHLLNYIHELKKEVFQ